MSKTEEMHITMPPEIDVVILNGVDVFSKIKGLEESLDGALVYHRTIREDKENWKQRALGAERKVYELGEDLYSRAVSHEHDVSKLTTKNEELTEELKIAAEYYAEACFKLQSAEKKLEKQNDLNTLNEPEYLENDEITDAMVIAAGGRVPCEVRWAEGDEPEKETLLMVQKSAVSQRFVCCDMNYGFCRILKSDLKEI